MSDCTDWEFLKPTFRILIHHKRYKYFQEFWVESDINTQEIYKLANIYEKYDHCKLYRQHKLLPENIKLHDLENLEGKSTLVFEVKSVLSK